MRRRQIVVLVKRVLEWNKYLAKVVEEDQEILGGRLLGIIYELQMPYEKYGLR